MGSLVDFVQAGGREVRGFLRFPRTHPITTLVFDSDLIVNAANCRSLFDSGVERGGPSDFARVVVDVPRVARSTVSFLDLTSVIEGQGVADAVRPVGLVLGGTDAVALDTLAAHVVGYAD
jgi:uncharacterized protein (DUF362 family)